MGRGAKEQQNLANTQAGGYQQTASGTLGLETPALTQQLQNPGFDPKTADAIRRSGMDTTNSAFDASKFSAAQRAGSTGNDAMFYASANDLAQKRAAGLSTAATDAEVKIGTQALDSQQKAIQDASQLYGMQTGAATNMYGQATQAMLGRKDPISVGWSAKDGLSVSG